MGEACDLISVPFLQRFPEPAVGMRSESSRNLQRRFGPNATCDVYCLCKIIPGCLDELKSLACLSVICQLQSMDAGWYGMLSFSSWNMLEHHCGESEFGKN